jgi:hypothetical protein
MSQYGPPDPNDFKVAGILWLLHSDRQSIGGLFTLQLEITPMNIVFTLACRILQSLLGGLFLRLVAGGYLSSGQASLVIEAVAVGVVFLLTLLASSVLHHLKIDEARKGPANNRIEDIKREAWTRLLNFFKKSGITQAILIFSLLVLPLAGCSKSDFERAQKLSNRAAIAVATAPILIASLVDGKLIDADLGKTLVDGVDTFGGYITKANSFLQAAKGELTGEQKLSISQLLATARIQLDAFSAASIPGIKSLKARERLDRFLNLSRALLASISEYLRLNSIQALFARPVKEADVAALEEAVRPVTPEEAKESLVREVNHVGKLAE